MDVKKIIIILFLMVSSAYSMSPRLDSLRNHLTLELNIPDSGTDLITTSLLNKSINDGINAVCNDYDAIFKIDTLILYADSEGVQLPSDYLRIRGVFRMVTNSEGYAGRVPIPNVKADTVFFKRTSTFNDFMTDKNFYMPRSWHIDGKRLFSHPKWTIDSCLLLVEYYANESDLSADSDTTQVPSKYLQDVLTWARYKVNVAIGRIDEAGNALTTYELKRKRGQRRAVYQEVQVQ